MKKNTRVLECTSKQAHILECCFYLMSAGLLKYSCFAHSRTWPKITLVSNLTLTLSWFEPNSSGCLPLYVWRTVSRGHCSSMGDWYSWGQKPHPAQHSHWDYWCHLFGHGKVASFKLADTHETEHTKASGAVSLLWLKAQRWLMLKAVVIHVTFSAHLLVQAFTNSTTF